MVDSKSKEWVSLVEQQFRKLAGENNQISVDGFKEIFANKESPYIPRLFEIFDKDKSGFISFGEVIDSIQLLTNGTELDKLRLIFDVADVNGDGSIDCDEMYNILANCLTDSNISITDDELKQLNEVIFEEADTDDDGTITFEELQTEFQRYPDVLKNLNISIPGWFQLSKQKEQKKSFSLISQIVSYKDWATNHNNQAEVTWVVLFFFVNLLFFTHAAHKFIYKGANWYIVIARGNGACLNFNCAIIVVLVLRKLLTEIRSSLLSKYIKIDENIDFHRAVGYTIAMQAFAHTVAHIGNAICTSADSGGKVTAIAILFTNPHLTTFGHPWVAGTAFMTGWALVFALTIMVVCSFDFIRRQGYFLVFYYTHLLFVPFWILLLMHGPRFWKFFLIPGVIFVIEKIANMEIIRNAVYGKSFIKKAHLLPSGVTCLEITRPPNFIFEPGDYVFIKLPQLAKYEWHPFTISSAPEQDGVFTVHVRSAGNWTGRLYKYIDKKIQQQEEENEDTLPCIDEERTKKTSGTQDLSIKRKRTLISHAKVSMRRKTSSYVNYGAPIKIAGQKDSKKVEQFWDGVSDQVMIEGPYGSPTRAIFNAEHAVLIGAGIGITPFASILQSIMYRYRLSKHTCPKCDYVWSEDIPSSFMELKKVDFYWINRDHTSFEWFVSLLGQLEYEQSQQENIDRFLEMNMFMTGAKYQQEMKGIALQLALEALHKKQNKDILTGLKTKTQAGRPDWDKEFQKINQNKKGFVEVFFCGAPKLGEVLKKYCDKYGFAFHKESF